MRRAAGPVPLNPSWSRRWRRGRRLPLEYVLSAVDAWQRRVDLAGVETYCSFIGYPRSGKSLLRALLGAHPQVVISDELDVLRYLQLGFRRQQVLSLILSRDRRYAAERARSQSYDYVVPTRHGGQFTELRVIGDNKGGATTQHLRRHPDWLDRLERAMRVPVRHLHVTRNPFDNIASMYVVTSWSHDLSTAVELYAGLCAGVAEIKRRISDTSLLDLRHEDLLAAPRDQLERACTFLGVATTPVYLDDCAGTLRSTPERTREMAPWTPELHRRVHELIDAHEFLSGYSWQS